MRHTAGLFDVSHMGEIEIEGEEAAAFVDWLVTNDIAGARVGTAVYTPMCYPNGGVVDDLLVYKCGDGRFMLVVNAANTEKTVRWIKHGNPWVVRSPGKMGTAAVRVVDRSAEIALMAFQGPAALGILRNLVDVDLESMGFFEFTESARLFERTVLVSRTGYTGEDGFEIFARAKDTPMIWEGLLELGAREGVLPCGLGARDTLRIEARLPLYGQEISSDISPLEGGLKPFVKFEKADFCGKERLIEMQTRGVPRMLRGIRMIDKGVPRTGYPVLLQGKQVGIVTSGMKSPMLDSFIGLVLVESDTLKKGMTIEIDFGPKRKRAEIVSTPFYRNRGVKK